MPSISIGAGQFSFRRGERVLTYRSAGRLGVVAQPSDRKGAFPRRRSGTPFAKQRAGGPDAMRLRITLFTAAFVMLPVAAFALLIGEMVWRRLSGVA